MVGVFCRNVGRVTDPSRDWLGKLIVEDRPRKYRVPVKSSKENERFEFIIFELKSQKVRKQWQSTKTSYIIKMPT